MSVDNGCQNIEIGVEIDAESRKNLKIANADLTKTFTTAKINSPHS